MSTLPSRRQVLKAGAAGLALSMFPVWSLAGTASGCMPRFEGDTFKTGIPPLDDLLGGGFRVGSISILNGSVGCCSGPLLDYLASSRVSLREMWHLTTVCERHKAFTSDPGAVEPMLPHRHEIGASLRGMTALAIQHQGMVQDKHVTFLRTRDRRPMMGSRGCNVPYCSAQMLALAQTRLHIEYLDGPVAGGWVTIRCTLMKNRNLSCHKVGNSVVFEININHKAPAARA